MTNNIIPSNRTNERSITEAESVTVAGLIETLSKLKDQSRLVYFTMPDIEGEELCPVNSIDEDGIGVYLFAK